MQFTPTDIVRLMCAFGNCKGVVFGGPEPTHCKVEKEILYLTRNEKDTPISKILSTHERHLP